RRGEKHQAVADDWRAFSTRWKSRDPPALGSVREVVRDQPLVGPEVAAEHEDLVDPVVTPIHWRRPSKLKPGAVCFPDRLAVAAIDAEQVGVFPLMIEDHQ